MANGKILISINVDETLSKAFGCTNLLSNRKVDSLQIRHHTPQVLVGLSLDEAQHAFTAPGIQLNFVFLGDQVHLAPEQLNP